MPMIVPANLRKRWIQELAGKVCLPSVVLEARSSSSTTCDERGFDPGEHPRSLRS